MLTACGKPLPPDKQTYAGDWQAANMQLWIDTGGRVRYKRREGSSTRSIEGPIKRFEGDNFLVGIGPLSTTFVVTAIPHERNGTWHMTVDGVELSRTTDLNVERW